MEGLALRNVLSPMGSPVRAFLPQKVFTRGAPAAFPAFKSKACVLQLRRSPALKVQAKKQTFTSFDDMIANSDLPVLVDFYATWCGPCQFMAPILSEVGKEMQEKIRIVKVDTEKYPAIASRYGIRSLPTFVIFVDGRPINWKEGYLNKEDLIAHVDSVLVEEESRTQSARVD
ncbi:thioredoxin [Marchantia polymorpha subsp. ruderalis]|uniref:Thioredoxin domain-containing protein n=2 Tax=Marchantia polymorpha TaxID=3197 RepID=A0AAF6BL19_MARPO|nr:hypothetical protein MARPO_0166s0016 [Marchantia polymorpha]BBN12703.1 hypothetical protein Mp_5g22220 [Marchantia polymorpha subsp. ruderalis]|eukprot:PTQ28359.1 hypothetical protein MARPO_0166s0016 [Marchantia polymorpha]